MHTITVFIHANTFLERNLSFDRFEEVVSLLTKDKDYQLRLRLTDGSTPWVQNELYTRVFDSNGVSIEEINKTLEEAAKSMEAIRYPCTQES